KGTPLPVCTTPASQPSNLNLNATGDSMNGTFTAASPAPDNYLVVISTSPAAPSLTNGTTYTVGATIGTATAVDTDNNTSFTATRLRASPAYYLYICSFTQNCVGGPQYALSTP